MPIDWIKSHPGYVVFASPLDRRARLPAGLEERAAAGPRVSRSPSGLSFLLTLIAGGAAACRRAAGLGNLLVFAMISGLLVALEIGSPPSAEAASERCAARRRPWKPSCTREQKLHLHIEQTPLGVMELDLEGRLIEWNTRRRTHLRVFPRGSHRQGLSRLDRPGIRPQGCRRRSGTACSRAASETGQHE